MKNAKPRKMARQMGIEEEEYGKFRAAFKRLKAEGRLVQGSGKSLTFPNGDTTLTGVYTTPSGTFGFVVPDDKSIQGDVFVPEGLAKGARDGDSVLVQIVSQPREPRDGGGQKRSSLRTVGKVVEIKVRAKTTIVGTLEKSDDTYFVIPDGRRFSKPIMVRDVSGDNVKPGVKVQVDIIWQPEGEGFPEGVILKVFGEAGVPKAEIMSVMAAYNLDEDFSNEVYEDAHRAVDQFKADDAKNRVRLTEHVVTIDPDTAKDYDDAISLEQLDSGNMLLGVHIADVSHFVEEDAPLDVEAMKRGMSVYFPGFVNPMLPAVLSNGVCSLQEGVERYCLSMFIEYDANGVAKKAYPQRTAICSAKRFTYKEAQGIIDTGEGDCKPELVALLQRMDALAKRIEQRKKTDGMIHLNLPEIELQMDAEGKVTGAHKADNSYTHKIIEMFMVEANEQVATYLNNKNVIFPRRIHPRPDEDSLAQLAHFVRACGYDLPDKPTLHHLSQLIASLKDKPESYAINLAVLRSFQRATYQVESEVHFALAIEQYCHFTSPIRRYPDLMVHRQLIKLMDGKKMDNGEPATKEMDEHCANISIRERTAQSAELELRMVLILQHLKEHIGEVFTGVITGVADFGIFVQHPDFLIEGLVRLPDLGDDWWEVSSEDGKVRGDFSGKVFKIGDTLEVRIDDVNMARRQLEISPSYAPRKLARSDASTALQERRGASQKPRFPKKSKFGSADKSKPKKGHPKKDKKDHPKKGHPKKGAPKKGSGKQRSTKHKGRQKSKQ